MKDKVTAALKNLQQDIFDNFSLVPIYYDVVSVELKEKRNYTIYWFGPDKKFLDLYARLIKDYFSNSKNISLLFLELPENKTSRHLYLYPQINESNLNVNYDESIIQQILLDNPGQKIISKDESDHINTWNNFILTRTESCFVTFSKIKFNIANSKYSSAIWIGYGKKNGIESVQSQKILYETLLEKFLWEHSLTTIASDSQQQIIVHATRAAISQVMARNMSHNIGSHVLSRYKNYPHDIVEFLDKCEINHLVDKKECITIAPKKGQYLARGLGLSKNGKKNLENILYFNEYLKNRMDFLADIATTDPSMESPMYFVREVMNGIDKNRILLDRISGIDSIKFDFCVRHYNAQENKWERIADHESKRDQILSVSNDILGCQAFYIIIENVIRNVAKHSKLIEKSLLVYIDIQDYKNNDDYFEISIYDCLMKTQSSIDELVKKRNETFNDSVLDTQSYQVRTGNLGTVEMKVCAAYLRMLPIASIEDKFFNVNDNKYNSKNDVKVPNLIYAYTHEYAKEKYGEKRYSLGYKICIRKPQTILIIDDSNILKLKDNDEIKNLRKYGIWIVKINELTNEDNFYNHQFIIWLSDHSHEEIIRNNYGRLPKRLLDKSDLNSYLNNLPSKLEPKKFINECWILYGKKLLSKKKNELNRIEFINRKLTTCLKSYNKQTKNVKKIYIDDHGKKWNTDEANQCDYYELICSHHRMYSIVDNGQLSNNFPHRQTEFAEAILSKIIIIDERIQKNIVISNKEYHGTGGTKILFKELFAKQNIFIPETNEANLNAPNFGVLKQNDISNENNKSESDKIKDYINGKIEYCDFCIIHLGILEKMLEVNINKTETEINKIIERIIGTGIDQRRKIIITSGRGKPHNIPKDLSFLSISIVQNAVETLFDKFLFVKLLYNSRKTL
ncbi:MAG: hypothetical protein ACYDEE_06160 [Ignavibacteriaceae bacterium]